MSRLVWMILGLVGGVAIARNAPAMPAPAAAAVVLCAVAGCGICWWAAYRGKSQAVATAVATAVAQATVEFEARLDAQAAAVAQAAVNLYLGDGDPRAAVRAQPEASPVPLAVAEFRELVARGDGVASAEARDLHPERAWVPPG